MPKIKSACRLLLASALLVQLKSKFPDKYHIHHCDGHRSGRQDTAISDAFRLALNMFTIVAFLKVKDTHNKLDISVYAGLTNVHQQAGILAKALFFLVMGEPYRIGTNTAPEELGASWGFHRYADMQEALYAKMQLLQEHPEIALDPNFCVFESHLFPEFDETLKFLREKPIWSNDHKHSTTRAALTNVHIFDVIAANLELKTILLKL